MSLKVKQLFYVFCFKTTKENYSFSDVIKHPEAMNTITVRRARSWSPGPELESDFWPLVKTAIFSRNFGAQGGGKFSLYRSVQAPIGARTLRLQRHLSWMILP